MYGCSGSNIKKVALRIGITLPDRRFVNPCETFNRGIIKKPFKICLNCGKEFTPYGPSALYCCPECQKEYQHKRAYQLIIDGDPSIMRANYSPRIFKDDILKEQDGKCAICGIEPE